MSRGASCRVPPDRLNRWNDDKKIRISKTKLRRWETGWPFFVCVVVCLNGNIRERNKTTTTLSGVRTECTFTVPMMISLSAQHPHSAFVIILYALYERYGAMMSFSFFLFCFLSIPLTGPLWKDNTQVRRRITRLKCKEDRRRLLPPVVARFFFLSWRSQTGISS